MARIEKTIFISYRRADVYTALAVYENLKNQGYDVFFDYRSISSGDFEQIITSKIRARAHFILILTPTALDRCNEPGDWLRREIELAIDEKRNIVPLFFRGFRFGTHAVSDKMTGKLKNLGRYNGLNVHEDYFEEAMQRVRTQFLSKPLDTVLHPVSTEVRRVVKAEQDAADEALKHKETVIESVKDKPVKKKELQKPTILKPEKKGVKSPSPQKEIPWRIVGGITGILTVVLLCVWSSTNLWNNLSSGETEPTRTPELIATQTPRTVTTNTPSHTKTSAPPTRTFIPPTPTLGTVSTLISDQDGMTLLYVPAGEFTMGSDSGNDDERPVHTVTLDAFWIDQTEVTNAMYAKCVQDGVCDQPSSIKSFTRDSYYGNSEFDNYPVINVSWNDAKTYCEWAGRHLPTEAEWEKAARGEDRRSYPWGNQVPSRSDLLNYFNMSAETTEVGNYPNGASPYGALDMAGNVYEWVADWYGETYYANSPKSNPLGPDSGQSRVLRGGSAVNDRSGVRSASRYSWGPTGTTDLFGFRCAMDANP